MKALALIMSASTDPDGATSIDLFLRGLHLHSSYFTDGNGVSCNALEDLILRGATVRIRRVERYFPRLRKACAEVTEQAHGPAWVNAYISTKDSQGLGRHRDEHSVLAIQILGEKVWLIEGMDTELVLQEGSTVFIPRGIEHSAKTSSYLSVHFALGSPVKRDPAAMEALGREIYTGFDDTQSCIAEQQVRTSYPRLSLLETIEVSNCLESKLHLKKHCCAGLASTSGRMLSSKAREFIEGQEQESISIRASIEHYGLMSVLEGLNWLSEEELLQEQIWS